jgi:hypothetical protein
MMSDGINLLECFVPKIEAIERDSQPTITLDLQIENVGPISANQTLDRQFSKRPPRHSPLS